MRSEHLSSIEAAFRAGWITGAGNPSGQSKYFEDVETAKYMSTVSGPSKANPLCANCNRPKDHHFGVNFADGNMVSGVVPLCPKAAWRETRKRT